MNWLHTKSIGRSNAETTQLGTAKPWERNNEQL